MKNICIEYNLDYEIITCIDGIDILRFVCDEVYFSNIKIIITDENMEYLNGSETIKIIRLIEQRKKAFKKLIISLTCQEEFSIIDNITECGANVHLSKPVTKQKLLDIIIEGKT